MDTNKTQQNNGSFEDYRRQMEEKRSSEPGRKVTPGMHRPLAIAFGIFMALVFIGMGVLMIINYFNWTESIAWMRWILGVVFIIYGIFRGYRLISGNDYYSNR